MKRPLCLIVLLGFFSANAQQPSQAALRWADSVLATLNESQRIGQLMMVRMSSVDASGTRVTFYENEVREAVVKYNIGSVCLFQGGPLKQAMVINNLQQIAKTPLFFAIDGEYGLGMRMDSVGVLPRQMTMGAVDDPTVVYEYGRLVGEQCKRMGIHINFAPVVDVNNNPSNPVINDRSFGEDKYRVALLGMQYMRGMQDMGIMACAKHFPGHGDVGVDSHVDLPVVKKPRDQLDSMELYPFRQMIKAGVGAVMVGHLYVPAIDNTPNRPASISYNHVTQLLRNEFGHKGIIVTDALEMKAVSKYFSPGALSVEALKAGNDILCLPGDVGASVAKIREAIRNKTLSWETINERVRRVLAAKFQYGAAHATPIDLNNLAEDLNAGIDEMRRLVAQRSITLLRNEDAAIFPIPKGKRVAYIGLGLERDNLFGRELRDEYGAHVYYFDYRLSDTMINPLLELLGNRYDVVVLGLHRYSRFPQNDFGVSQAAFRLIRQVQQKYRTITLTFGNPYAMSRMCDSKVLVACYQDDNVTQQTAADLVLGRLQPKGKLPVSVCPALKEGEGIVSDRLMPSLRPADLGFRAARLVTIDSIVNDAIRNRAIPGAVVLVAKDGRVAYERAYGYLGYDSTDAVYPETIYDLASLTKIMATTLAVMKLYDEGKLVLTRTLGDYLPWTRGTNKENLRLWNILLHQAGLKGWIPFYRETLDPAMPEMPSFSIYASAPDSIHAVRVAEGIYMRRDWADTLTRRIIESSVAPQGIYLYSDLDFIFLGKIVETITGMSLDQFVRDTFFNPLGLVSTTFRPREKFPLYRIAPTENEPVFRRQLLRGDVHDPGAAMMGGVAGHAGLFGTAYELAVLCQMLLNGGQMNGIRFFSKGTVELFTSYHGNARRGLGFDKPEKDNHLRPEPYPTLSASPFTFGHTGFTGTCVWADPLHNLIFIFLSNRVYNNDDPARFNRMNVRPKVHELVYESLLGDSDKKLARKETQNLY